MMPATLDCHKRMNLNVCRFITKGRTRVCLRCVQFAQGGVFIVDRLNFSEPFGSFAVGIRRLTVITTLFEQAYPISFELVHSQGLGALGLLRLPVGSPVLDLSGLVRSSPLCFGGRRRVVADTVRWNCVVGLKAVLSLLGVVLRLPGKRFVS